MITTQNALETIKNNGYFGVAFSTISRWLNGKVKPNKIQAFHIEKFLKARKQK